MKTVFIYTSNKYQTTWQPTSVTAKKKMSFYIRRFYNTRLRPLLINCIPMRPIMILSITNLLSCKNISSYIFQKKYPKNQKKQKNINIFSQK